MDGSKATAENKAIADSEILDRLVPFASRQPDDLWFKCPFRLTLNGEHWTAATNKWIFVAFRHDADVRKSTPGIEKWFQVIVPKARKAAPHLLASLKEHFGQPVLSENKKCESCGGTGTLGQDPFRYKCPSCDKGVRTEHFPFRPAMVDERIYNANAVGAVLGLIPTLTVRCATLGEPNHAWPLLFSWDGAIAVIASRSEKEFGFTKGPLPCYSTLDGSRRPWSHVGI